MGQVGIIIFVLLCFLRAIRARHHLMALKILPTGTGAQQGQQAQVDGYTLSRGGPLDLPLDPPRASAAGRSPPPLTRLPDKGPRGGPLDPPRASAAGRSPPPLTRLLAVEGATLDAQTIAAARSWMLSNHLEILDLVPGRAPCETALHWADALRLGDMARTRFERGSSARYALMVSRSVWERAGIKVESPLSPTALDELAAQLKRFANRAFGHVVLPSCKAPVMSAKDLASSLRKAGGVGAAVFLCARMIVLASLWSLVFVRPWWGAAALLSYHLIPALALAGSKIRADDLLLQTSCRSLCQIVRAVRLLTHWLDETEVDREISRLRTVYAELLAQHPEQEREPRAESCPICPARDLVPFLTASDLAQGKPGYFSLEKCRACGHVFQNPRLNSRGLAFYYRDYYDGLGAQSSEDWYARMTKVYASRANSVRQVHQLSQPKTWLDVGLGQGHFCCFARDVFPETHFHGLDRSENVSLALRRRWIDEAFCGQFIEFAREHANQYDVVSLFQYLEHTPMPLEELKAAHTVLAPGGYLVIDVPNPEFRLASILGRFWIPWMQPQHLHFFAVDNLARVLTDRGFVEVKREFREVHEPADLVWSLGLILRRFAPLSPLPWRKQAAPAWRLLKVAVWIAALPLFIAATMVDHVTALKKTGESCSNHYRLVARKLER